jgi:hypothetical protein
MTTAAAIYATEVILNAVSLVQDIPLSRIRNQERIQDASSTKQDSPN